MGVHWSLILSGLVACSDNPFSDGTSPPPPSESPLSGYRPPTPPTQPPPPAPKWTDPASVGHGVNAPLVEALVAEEPYEVPDPVTGTVRTLLHMKVQLDVPGQPDRVYPISPTEGWVLVLARDTQGGPDVMLAYRLFWDTSKETLRGDVGVFVVKETVIVQVGDEDPRMTWTKDGEFWVMHTLP